MADLISQDMRVSEMLKRHPETLEALVRFHPHFRMLRNPVLRKTMARLVTVAQAARVAGVAVEDLLLALNTAIGQRDAYLMQAPPARKAALVAKAAPAAPASEKPAFLQNLPPERIRTLDVRSHLEAGEDPFHRIMAAVRELPREQVLHLVVPFEPLPLYEVMAQRGFRHWSESAGETWHVYFYRAEAMPETAPEPAPEPAAAYEELDVRGLEPPQPMMRILEVLAQKRPETLVVHHHREPHLLYEKLEARGYTARTEKLGEAHYRITITLKSRGA